MLKLRGLRVAGRDGPVVDALDLDVEAGEAVLVLGPSGSGKSLLLRVAAGLQNPAAGRVYASRRRAFVFAEGGLVNNLDLRANLALPLAWGGEPGEDARSRADAALARFGLQDVAKERPMRLGPEVRQLAQYARAEALDAELLLLQEPLRGLSKSGARVAAAWLLDRLERGASGVLMASSDPGLAARFPCRVLSLGSVHADSMAPP